MFVAGVAHMQLVNENRIQGPVICKGMKTMKSLVRRRNGKKFPINDMWLYMENGARDASLVCYLLSRHVRFSLHPSLHDQHPPLCTYIPSLPLPTRQVSVYSSGLSRTRARRRRNCAVESSAPAPASEAGTPVASKDDASGPGIDCDESDEEGGWDCLRSRGEPC